ncbi:MULTISPECIES: NUDIX hydrolase [Thermomonospora]|uniref:NUDIX hydrolase n=1 Tax=Thermomonospora curvata (strain ATCC 19995 / DSM 43183 / JCM 3096 / KCTC 9072 / NBRC 15933 / NCIMB 10081 / Henssen B9) TaxID=471852 RepID=D1A9J4_THECD|nr:MULTISPECIES: NUDIX hydrolase [Thermomonospora]ACY98680.1 NUDIX hydrolase [Thermomonospora curvata DSM 43183]PKK13805.1 MAG: NUDIX hydrolase [Thermomonospora sp. CIF 1]
MKRTPDTQREEEFLASYDPRAYDPVAVTVDVVALTIRDGALHVLLVRRGAPPFAGMWALPGGFVRGVREAEDLPQAAARELAEETGLSTEEGALARVHLEQLATYGAPGRDPRMRVISVAYLAFAPELPDPRAGSDAADAAWVPVDSLGLTEAGTQRPGTTRKLAFDHAQILADGLERARSKLEYTPLATAFCAPEFTIPELRAVYEAVWGEELHAGNFHRKVLSVPGFVESTGETTERGGRRGGPRARLYRAGDARLLHPALLRPSREEQVR